MYVWKCRDQVLDAISQCPALQIEYPDLDDVKALRSITRGFEAKSYMGVLDKCIGALDGMLVKLQCVKGLEQFRAARYFTRKGFFALNMQAVRDANREFLWYSIEHPGNTHDSLPFTRGMLAYELENKCPLPDGMYLVGDCAYKAIPGVITPFEGRNLTVWQDCYNFYHSQTRINIECAFGMLVVPTTLRFCMQCLYFGELLRNNICSGRFRMVIGRYFVPQMNIIGESNRALPNGMDH